MMRISTTPFRVNGLRYRPPAKPLAVVCIDGCGPEYLIFDYLCNGVQSPVAG